MSTSKNTLKDVSRPFIHGGKHLALGVGMMTASFILFVIVAALTGDGPPLLIWGIGTVIIYRVFRHRFI